jgi:hypothetical protein
MATDKTRLTELATAVGLVWEPSTPWPDGLEALTVPGLDPSVWRPAVLPATAVGSPHRDLLLRALENGRAFRRDVLGGRLPGLIEWQGGSRSVWTSDIPRDLTVDGVWFIQAKYDSTCVLNTSPGSLVDDLLVDRSAEARRSWFEEVALDELQSFYDTVRAGAAMADPDGSDGSDGSAGSTVPTLPADVRDLDHQAKGVLKVTMRDRPTSAASERAYGELCRAVSIETTLRWRHQLDGATVPQRTQMLFRMLRISGGPYWLLGVKGHEPIRLRVADTRSWRERFELKAFRVLDAHAGQPQVNWRAEIGDRASRDRHVVDGFCEIRWSHGKLQGNPECKVQVTTPLAEIPGYTPMA